MCMTDQRCTLLDGTRYNNIPGMILIDIVHGSLQVLRVGGGGGKGVSL